MVLRHGETPHAKLLDFGVAKLTSSDIDATRTVADEVLGTPAYMSPEQASGKPLDARSDVFSLGAVLYELLAGTRAFTGDSTAEILSAVLRDEAVAAFERAHALAPWFGVASGWLAAVHRLTGREDRADALLAAVGPTSKPLWGRVVYHLLTSELDAAADSYEQMIEERDPFALLYARTPTLGPLRDHHRWPDLAALMKLPAVATPT